MNKTRGSNEQNTGRTIIRQTYIVVTTEERGDRLLRTQKPLASCCPPEFSASLRNSIEGKPKSNFRDEHRREGMINDKDAVRKLPDGAV